MPAVMFESKERKKVTFFERVGFLFSEWDYLGTNIDNDAQIEWVAVGRNLDVLGRESVPKAKSISRKELSDDNHDIILNRKRFDTLLMRSGNMILAVQHSGILKDQRKYLCWLRSKIQQHWAEQR